MLCVHCCIGDCVVCQCCIGDYVQCRTYFELLGGTMCIGDCVVCVHCCIGDCVVCSLLHRGLCCVFTVA